MPSYYYAVAMGRTPGVYPNWSAAKAQVDGYVGARYKRFSTREEAEGFVRHLGSSVLEQLARATPTPQQPIATMEVLVPRDPMRDPHAPDTLVVFCDGSAFNNGRRGARGGYAIVWPHHSQLNASAPLPPGTEHTNNRAEFQAFIAAMEAAHSYDPSDTRALYVYTDSMLLLKTVTQWMSGWKKKGWRKADGRPVANLDLVQRMDTLLATGRRLIWRHVEAHTGRQDWESYWNDQVDRAARATLEAPPPH